MPCRFDRLSAMLLRLLAVRGGSQPVNLVQSEPITVQASPTADGTPAEESAFFEADMESGAALVTWLGGEGCARIFRKGGTAPELLEAGEQVVRATLNLLICGAATFATFRISVNGMPFAAGYPRGKR